MWSDYNLGKIWVLFVDLEPLTTNMSPIMSFWVFCYHFKWTRSANKTLYISRGSPSHAALNEIRSAFIKGISAKGTWLASLTYSASLGGNLILLVKWSQFSDKKPMPSQAQIGMLSIFWQTSCRRIIICWKRYRRLNWNMRNYALVRSEVSA